MVKISTLVGARPQFIKAAAVSRAISTSFANEINESIIHTGQHYDKNMSQIFFDELDIPKPHHNMHVSSSRHGEMTGRMLELFESYLLENKSDYVLVYGDTNSTLAGMLAAVKLGIPVAHVEAGLRSYNTNMPEEINRILVDRLSTLLFCPTEQAVKNLAKEGLNEGIHQTGDVMFDVALYYKERATQKSNILIDHNLNPDEYFLVTCHRAENTDDPIRLNQILSALAEIVPQQK
jgi:UDP-N-acetylglucosamine 2-epimerase